MYKIKRISRFFRIVFQLAFVAMIVVQIIGWVYAPQPLRVYFGLINVIPGTYEHIVPQVLSFNTKLCAFLLSTIPLTIELLAVYFLIKLFRLFEDGEIFSLRNVRYIRNVGYALLLNQVIDPFYQFFMGPILTWNNHPHTAAITIDQTNFSMALTGLIIILISWIMAEAYKLREEQQLTI